MIAQYAMAFFFATAGLAMLAVCAGLAFQIWQDWYDWNNGSEIERLEEWYGD